MTLTARGAAGAGNARGGTSEMGGQLQREGAEGGREPGPAGAEPYSPRG